MERCIENAESYCKSYPRCYRCNAFREPTNADRIRAMSDEELAELLWAIIHERDVIVIEKLNKKGIEASLIEVPDRDIAAQLEWLKQPAEVDNG